MYGCTHTAQTGKPYGLSLDTTWGRSRVLKLISQTTAGHSRVEGDVEIGETNAPQVSCYKLSSLSGLMSRDHFTFLRIPIWFPSFQCKYKQCPGTKTEEYVADRQGNSGPNLILTVLLFYPCTNRLILTNQGKNGLHTEIE